MDFKQLLPLLMKGRLGEKEQALLNVTRASDPAAIGDLLMQMQKKTPQVNAFATLKKILPAQTLGQIIKYYDTRK